MATELKPDELRTRQNLRHMGRKEIMRRCREMFPKYNRRELKQLVVELEKQAWDKRDRGSLQLLKNRKEE